MKRFLNLTAAAAFCASVPAFAQEAKTYPAPSEIVAAAKADIQADLNAAIAKADAEIAAKSAESEKRIGEIRAGAVEAVTEVAKDTAKELVAVLGGKADAKAITAAVTARLKG